MPERIEVVGPNGPVVVDITDADLSQYGRAGAIEHATAALVPVSGSQRDTLSQTRNAK